MFPADAWADLFDDGDRWPTCTITISTSMPVGAPFTRALGDIRRDTGIRVRRVPSGGQVQVSWGHEPELAPYATSAAMPYPRGTYEAGSVLLSSWFFGNSKRVQRSMWQHELGHILGLGHTSKKGEVMGMVNRGALSTRGWRRSLRHLYPECRAAA